MTKQEKQAIAKFCRTLEDVVMKFAVEVYRATGKLMRDLEEQ